MRSTVTRRLEDLRAALMTAPGARAWGACAMVFVAFVVCAGGVGVMGGLLRASLPHLAARDALATAAMVLVHPALTEEIVFRGLLLPRDAGAISRRRWWLVAGVALALYVAAHPINALLLRPEVARVFTSPLYLTLVTLLGIACTAAYVVSRSIWPPVVLHWLTVLAWLWFFGGQRVIGG